MTYYHSSTDGHCVIDALIVPCFDFDPTATDCGSNSCATGIYPLRESFADCFGDYCCAPPDWDSSSTAANLSDRADSTPVPEAPCCTAYPSGSSPSPAETDPFVAWPEAENTVYGGHWDWYSCGADSTTDCCADADPDFRRHPSASDFR